MHREANRPWPVLCPEDDVIDYMVMEAVFLRVQKREAKEERDRRAREFKKDASSLKELT